MARSNNQDQLWAFMFVALIVAGVVIGYRIYKKSGPVPEKLPLQRVPGFEAIYEEATNLAELAKSQGASPGPLVVVQFHTYRGFLIHIEQHTHRVRLPATEAEVLLQLLHRYNLKHCLLLHKGSLFVPLMSWSEAREQRRSIRRQMAAMTSSAISQRSS